MQHRHRRGHSLIELLEQRTLFSVGTLIGASQDLGASIAADTADPVRNVVYVADNTNHLIVAIDTSTGNTTGLAVTTANVAGLAVSTDNAQLYASEPAAQKIEIFSLPTMQLVRSITTDNGIGQIVAGANGRVIGLGNGIEDIDAQTGTTLFTLPSDSDGLLRTNIAGTQLYSRARGLSGNDGSYHQWDISGTGMPVAQSTVLGPTGANSTDFDVDPVGGRAYFGDGGASGIEEVRLSDNGSALWGFDGGGAADGIAALEGGTSVYGTTFDGRIQQFNTSGVALASRTLPTGHTAETLVITPNGNLVYIFPTGVGIVGLSTLNISETRQLAFTTQPGNGLAGSPLSPAVTVSIEDPGGHIMTSDNSTVTLSLVSGSGSLGGTVSVAAQNGVATFSNLILTGPGPHALEATDGADGIAISNSFTLSEPHLRFVAQPTDTVVNQVIAPAITVEILDSSNNVVTADNSTVTLSVFSGSGVTVGTVTVAAQNGIATFSNLSITGGGGHILSAADGADTGALSNLFNVVGPSLAFLQQPTDTTLNGTISPPIRVEMLDANGALETNGSEPITISVGTGSGTLNGTRTVAAVNGIATFSDLSLNAGGAYTLRATDGVLTAASSTFHITGGIDVAGAHLVFGPVWNTLIAGAIIPQSVSVAVEDANNQIITSATPIVTLAAGSGSPGVLNGTVAVAAVNGVATFSSLSVNTAGAYTLTAASDGITAAIPQRFSVSPAPAAKLVFAQQPSRAIAGLVMRPGMIVMVEDTFGNLETNDRSKVKLSTASGPSTIGLKNATIAVRGGAAVINKMILTHAGDYTLLATDGHLAGAVSDSFTVDPNHVSHIVYVQQPVTGIAGTPLTPAPVVKLEDRFNNVISSSDTDVIFSVFSTVTNQPLQVVAVPLENGEATLSEALITGGRLRLAARYLSITAKSHVFTVALPVPSMPG